MMKANPTNFPGYQNSKAAVAQMQTLAMVGATWYTAPATMGAGPLAQAPKFPTLGVAAGTGTLVVGGGIYVYSQGGQVPVEQQIEELEQTIDRLQSELQALEDKLDSIEQSSKGQKGGIGPYNTSKTQQDIANKASQLGKLQAQLNQLKGG
jgi:DNA repair exonuclease SbcCD ATPase subunit